MTRSFSFLGKRQGIPSDLERGRRRARAAALLVAALPGALYIYQGDELGLDEVTELPTDVIRTPCTSARRRRPRPRRLPRAAPWSGTDTPFGFSPRGEGSRPWLPQPAHWRALSVEAQEADLASMLWLYRDSLRIRRSEPGLVDRPMTWLPSAEGVLAFARGDRFMSITNLTDAPVPLPAATSLLLASAPTTGGQLPIDATAWLRSDGKGPWMR